MSNLQINLELLTNGYSAVALDFLSFGAILSGILVITSSNPIVSVLFLIAVFVNVSGYLILLGLNFIGLTYLIVYVGAIAILFLFVIMMMNIKLAELTDISNEYTKNLPLGAIVGFILLFELFYFIPLSNNTNFVYKLFHYLNIFIINIENKNIFNSSSYQNVNLKISISPIWDNTFVNFSHIKSIGEGLYTIYTMWFIITSLILLLAMVGPIVLCIKPSSNR